MNDNNDNNTIQQLKVALGELYYAAGDCAVAGDFDGADAALRAASTISTFLRIKGRGKGHACIRLVSFGQRKIHVIKVLRAFYLALGLPLGLKEAKTIAENAGNLLPWKHEGSVGVDLRGPPLVLTAGQCEDFCVRLREAGAEVLIEDGVQDVQGTSP